MQKSLIIFLGLLAILMILESSNMNISNANAITEFDNKDKKQASISSLKCNNINVNVNGLELSIFPPFLGGDEVAAEAVEPNTDGNSFTNNNGDGSQINDFRFICINNNNNTVITEEPPIPPEPTTATLNVTKKITCVDQIEGDCEDLLEVINESRFPFQVEGNNPNPSSPFPGSPTGTDVTLGPGNYVVTETLEESVSDDLQNFVDNHQDPPRDLSLTLDFSGDCTSDIGEITEIQANGTILAGELQTCNALNDFNITSFSIPPPIPIELDMAIVNFGNDDVSIRLGNGDGTFNSTALDVPVGGRPQSIVVGFFNEDSNLDLAVVNQAPNVVSIRLGNGDGTFNSTAPNVPVGNVPVSLAVGRFNADSNLDLAVTNSVDGDVSIRLGNGDGTFNSTVLDVPVGNNPSYIAVGRFNADSNLDLAVANADDDNVSIRLGNGDGTFTSLLPNNSPIPDVAVGGNPLYIAVDFFDADSILDLAVANNGDGDVSIRLGNGDGTFTSLLPNNSPIPDVAVGGNPSYIAVGLFNADSNLDLAVANAQDNNVSIRLGNGDGTFTSLLPNNSPIPDVAVGNIPRSIAVGLFNADSNLDLAVANELDGDVSLRLGNGDGTFTLPANSPPDVVVGSSPSSIAVGDFDNN